MISLTIIAVVLVLFLRAFAWNIRTQYEHDAPALKLTLDLERTKKPLIGVDAICVLRPKPTEIRNYFAISPTGLETTNQSGNNTASVGWASCSNCVRGYDEIESWLTPAGDLDGLSTTGVTRTLSHRSQWFRNNAKTTLPFTKHIRFIVYHVAGDLAETQLGILTQSLGLVAESTYQNYATSIAIAAQAFGPDDKLKIQALGRMSRLL